MTVNECSIGGFRAWRIEGESVRVELISELGAKIVSLVDLDSGREWMTAPERPYRQADLDGEFSEGDRSGWDECFPTIAAGFYPSPPWRGTRIADHGELWMRPWQVRVEGETLITTIYGARFPYRFERRLRLDGRGLQAGYAVTNLTEYPFPCLWAMHPLFSTRGGMQVVVPGLERVRVEYARGAPGKDGFLAECAWPSSEGSEDLSLLAERSSGRALKLYSIPAGRVDRAALFDPQDGGWLAVRFDPATVTHLGLWLNQGGWPEQDGLHHAALEPCTGGSDDLALAVRLGEATTVGPYGTLSWEVDIRLGRGRRELDDLLRRSAL